LTGLSGCNRYFAQYRQNGSDLNFGPISGTRKICLELIMTAEQRFLSALGSVNGLGMKDGQLVLFGAGAELTFTQAK